MGLESDSYKIKLFVQIIDDSNAISIYYIAEEIKVVPLPSFVDGIMSDLISGKENSDFIRQLKSNDLQIVSRNIIAFTSLLNKLSSSNDSISVK